MLIINRIHLEGINIQIPNLYPAVEFPVSRGTPMVSPYIKWEHNEDWFVMKFEHEVATKSGERKVTISLSDLDYDYIVGHTIDGNIMIRDISIFINDI